MGGLTVIQDSNCNVENEYFQSGISQNHTIAIMICAFFLLSFLLIAPVSAFNDYSGPWVLVNASPGWTTRLAHSSIVMADDSIILMGGLDGGFNPRNDVWMSTDYGTTWTEMNASAGWTGRDSLSSVATYDGGIVLTGGRIGGTTCLNDTWRSMDKGRTWIRMNASSGWMPRKAHSTVVTSDGTIILTGGYDCTGGPKNDVWKSIDNGATWTQVNGYTGWFPRFYFSSVRMPDDNIVLMGGDRGGSNLLNDVWFSTDKGETWEQRKQNDNNGWSARYGPSSVVTPEGSIVLTGGGSVGYRNDTWQSTDKGETWILKNASSGWAPRTMHTSVAMSDGSIVLMGGGGGGTRNDVWRLMPNETHIDPDPQFIVPCNCTNRTVSIQSGPGSTRWTRVPFDGWRPAYQAVHPIPDSWATVPVSGRWIWANTTADGTSKDGRFTFQRMFNINTSCCWQNVTANFTIAADDEFNLTINNRPVNSPYNWHSIPEGPVCGQQNMPTAYSYDVLPYLHNGNNVINIVAQNHGVPCDPTPNNAGIVYNMTISYRDCCPPGYNGDCNPGTGTYTMNVINDVIPESTQAPLFSLWPFWK